MGAQTLRVLSEAQAATFDHDYVTDESFEIIAAGIDTDFPDGEFTFLDVGAGKGLFVDRVLERYPRSTGVVLDSSESLLTQNREHSRKRLSLVSATEMRHHFSPGAFDIIFFNFSLHHFVGNTYGESRSFQRVALSHAKEILAPWGRISVLENAYEGALHHNFPGYLTYRLARSTTLAPFIRRLGANTAGCGVCFLSTSAWRAEFGRAGLVEAAHNERTLPVYSWTQHLKLRLLTMRGVKHAHFWLAAT